MSLISMSSAKQMKRHGLPANGLRKRLYDSEDWFPRKGIPQRRCALGSSRCGTARRSGIRGNERPVCTLGQSKPNQPDVFGGEREWFPLHVAVILVRPTCLHDAVTGVPVDSLQDMRDLVGQHVSQDRVRRRRAGCLLYPVAEHGNVDSFEGAGECESARQEAFWCLWSQGNCNCSRG